MEPIIDLIWSVEDENEPDDIMMPMSANCGGSCSIGFPVPEPPTFVWGCI